MTERNRTGNKEVGLGKSSARTREHQTLEGALRYLLVGGLGVGWEGSCDGLVELSDCLLEVTEAEEEFISNWERKLPTEGMLLLLAEPPEGAVARALPDVAWVNLPTELRNLGLPTTPRFRFRPLPPFS